MIHLQACFHAIITGKLQKCKPFGFPAHPIFRMPNWNWVQAGKMLLNGLMVCSERQIPYSQSYNYNGRYWAPQFGLPIKAMNLLGFPVLVSSGNCCVKLGFIALTSSSKVGTIFIGSLSEPILQDCCGLETIAPSFEFEMSVRLCLRTGYGSIPGRRDWESNEADLEFFRLSHLF